MIADQMLIPSSVEIKALTTGLIEHAFTGIDQ